MHINANIRKTTDDDGVNQIKLPIKTILFLSNPNTRVRYELWRDGHLA